MLELEARRSAQVRRHRHAVECGLRHRRTLLPWFFLVDPPSAGSGAMCLAKSFAGIGCRGLRHGLAEIVVAVATQATPTSRPTPGFFRRAP